MAERFFKPLRDILNSILSLDVDQIALEIARTPTFKTLVIRLNTEDQLFNKGVDSTGRTLESIGGGYSPFTIEEKRKKEQPTDRVTLKDTGDFYLTFQVIPFKGGFTIEADPIKDDDNLFNRWGENIVGLNEDSLRVLIDFYRDAILEKIQEKLR